MGKVEIKGLQICEKWKLRIELKLYIYLFIYASNIAINK